MGALLGLLTGVPGSDPPPPLLAFDLLPFSIEEERRSRDIFGELIALAFFVEAVSSVVLSLGRVGLPKEVPVPVGSRGSPGEKADGSPLGLHRLLSTFEEVCPAPSEGLHWSPLGATLGVVGSDGTPGRDILRVNARAKKEVAMTKLIT